MALIKREESPLASFRKELDRFFEDFWGGRWPSVFEREVLSPPVEVGETAEEVFVNVQLPGMSKENLDIQLTEGALSIKGELREEKEEKKKNYYRQEFRYGGFSRSIPLPAEVEISKATADLDKGLLKVRIPKTEKAKQRAVAVPIR